MRRPKWRDGAWITVGLVVACVVVFIAEVLAGGSTNTMVLVQFGARFAPLVALGQYWRLLTAMFLHIGLLHLLTNMFTLFIIGRMTENLFGHWRFAVIYLLSGIGGNFAGMLFGQPAVVAAGASTALFGLLGAFLMIGDNFRHNPVIAGMTRQFLVLIALNLVFDLTTSGIDFAGHIGGLITGFLVAGVVGVPKIGQISSGRRIVMGATLVVAPVLLWFTTGGGY